MTGLVVVGCDGSAAGQPAVELAVREASVRDSKLRVVAVWTQPVPTYAAGWGYAVPVAWPRELSDELAAAASRHAEESLKAALDRTGCRPVTEVVVREGRPAAELLDAAKDADLLVVGTRGLGRWGRLRLGSTSTEVVHHAHVPVVVVPDRLEGDGITADGDAADRAVAPAAPAGAAPVAPSAL